MPEVFVRAARDEMMCVGDIDFVREEFAQGVVGPEAEKAPGGNEKEARDEARAECRDGGQGWRI